MRALERSVSQPDAVVPMRSNTPMAASRLAALTSGMPWSMQYGMRWVATKPLVENPQTAKLENKSQKSGERTPRASPDKATMTGFAVLMAVGGSADAR